MIDKSIIENNRKIVLFMGGIPSMISNELYNYEPFEVIRLGNNTYQPILLEYHSDWNKIMQVIDYIEKLAVEKSCKQEITFNFFNDITESKPAYWVKIEFGDIVTYSKMYEKKIDAVFHTILEFIDNYHTKYGE